MTQTDTPSGTSATASAHPALSIITICRNAATDIDDTCRSVVGQTYTDFEWIVIDGASTDGTLAILEEYRDRISFFITEPDSGVYNAMNKGIRLAGGDYLLFLNGGDCLAAKDTLSRIFAAPLSADVYYGDNYLLNPADGMAGYRMEIPAEDLDKTFFATNTINHQSALIRRELFIRYGLYDETFRIAADWAKWLEYLQAGCSFVKLDFPVAIFRLGGLSSTHSEVLIRELDTIRRRNFSPEEVAKLPKHGYSSYKYRTLWSFGKWGKFALLSAKYSPGIRVYSCLHVPYMKIRYKNNMWIYRLFGCIPFWRAKGASPFMVENIVQKAFPRE